MLEESLTDDDDDDGEEFEFKAWRSASLTRGRFARWARAATTWADAAWAPAAWADAAWGANAAWAPVA